MEEKPQKLLSTGAILMDIVLAVVFFVFMVSVCREHVPVEEEPYMTIFGALTSFCLTMVFWVALQFFRVTLVDQLRRKRARS